MASPQENLDVQPADDNKALLPSELIWKVAENVVPQNWNASREGKKALNLRLVNKSFDKHVSRTAFERLDYESLAEEAEDGKIPAESVKWLLKQKIQKSKDCRQFLAEQEDASCLFPKKCNFQELCQKDEDGKPIFTAEDYLENACCLAVKYRGAAKITSELEDSTPLWPEVAKCSLMVAAFAGEESLVQWLLEHSESTRGNLNYVSELLGSALFAAVLGFNSGTVSRLLNHGANAHDVYRWDYESPFTYAVGNEDMDTINALLLSDKVDPNKTADRVSPFLLACFGGHVDIVRRLLADPRVKPDEPSTLIHRMTPLAAAVKNGHTKVVQALLERGDVDPNRRNEGPEDHERPLYIAARYKHSDILKLLLLRKDIQANFISHDGHRTTPLRAVIDNGDEETAVYMASCPKVNPNLTQREDDTPILALAVKRRMVYLVNQLLQRQDVDINAVDLTGDSAPSVAAITGQVELFKWFLQRKDFNIQQSNLGTARLIGLVGVPEIIRLVLHHLPECLSARDSEGRTPLMLSCLNGNSETVRELLKLGVDTTLKDNQGYTALKWAERSADEGPMNILLGNC